MKNLAENALDGVNKIKSGISTEKSSKRKNLPQRKDQNVSFFSFIRLLLFPSQIELKDHSIRVSDQAADTFSLKQKHEFSRVFSPSATDFIFFSKSLEQFINYPFLVIAIFGSLDIRRLFNYLNFNTYYLFEFEFDIFGKLIQNDIDISNEQPISITEASSSAYFTPKIHYLLDGKARRNIAIYIPEGYFSIIRSLKQMAHDNDQLTIVLLSQLSDTHKEKYSSILSSLSLSTKSLISPKPKDNKNKSLIKSTIGPNIKMKENISNNPKNVPFTMPNNIASISNEQKNIENLSEKETSTIQDNEYFVENKHQDNSFQATPSDPVKNSEANEMQTNTLIKSKENDKNSTNEMQMIHINKENHDKSKINQSTPNKEPNGSSQSDFLKQMMENSLSSPNELSGIFDTLGSIIKRSENGWKQTNSELNELQSKLESMKVEQSKEAELLRIEEESLEQLQRKLVDIKKRRIDLLNEKDKLNSYVTRSISLTTKMKMQVREVVDRSSCYEKKIDEITQEMISSLESEASEEIQSHEIMAEMAILESEIESHLSAI